MAIFVALLWALPTWAQVVDQVPGSTADHVANSSWWPTKATPPNGFAGEQACAKCHAGKVRTQTLSAMARANFAGSDIARAGKPAGGTYREADQIYSYLTTDKAALLQVKAGDRSVSAPVSWIFGAGVHGQTYLVQHEGKLYEAQASSFAVGQLGLTPGHHPATIGSPEPNLGNRLELKQVGECFACHSTVWSAAENGTVTASSTGVHCEACHGPAAGHISSVQNGKQEEALRSIVNPAHFTPAMSVDFCGACHRTTMDVVLSDLPSGLSSIRFQPYRLQKSRCWEKTQDERLTCVACHDPHGPLVRDTAFYDAKCVNCHSAKATSHPASAGQAVKASVCPRASSGCTGCHMPKYTLPEMKSQFTDHMIRIVRSKDSFPN